MSRFGSRMEQAEGVSGTAALLVGNGQARVGNAGGRGRYASSTRVGNAPAKLQLEHAFSAGARP